jgi:chaperonin GroEL
MPKRELIRDVITKDTLNKKIFNGVEKAYNLAKTSYGANSGDVLLEYRYGEPLVSHDGITNLGALIVEDPVENGVISIIRQASERTNQKAGDATSLTTILTKHACDYYATLNLSPRELQKQIQFDFDDILARLEHQKIEYSPDILATVCATSANDVEIGEMVADCLLEAGESGGVITQEVPDVYTSPKIVDGLTIDRGLKSIAFVNDSVSMKTTLKDAPVVVLGALIDQDREIEPILQTLLRMDYKQFVMIGDISGSALQLLIDMERKGVIDCIVITPEPTHRDIVLEDIASYTGGEVFSGDPLDFGEKYIGKAEEVVATVQDMTISGGKGDMKKIVEALTLKRDNEQNSKDKLIIDKRLAMLTGKTVKILVGAPTQAERQEQRLRIDDAICAGRMVMKYGAVIGGGVALKNIGFPNYLNRPFEDITGKDCVDYEEFNHGFNLATGKDFTTPEVLDSLVAIQEAVRNSLSATSKILSIQTALVYKHDLEG